MDEVNGAEELIMKLQKFCKTIGEDIDSLMDGGSLTIINDTETFKNVMMLISNSAKIAELAKANKKPETEVPAESTSAKPPKNIQNFALKKA